MEANWAATTTSGFNRTPLLDQWTLKCNYKVILTEATQAQYVKRFQSPFILNKQTLTQSVMRCLASVLGIYKVSQGSYVCRRLAVHIPELNKLWKHGLSVEVYLKRDDPTSPAYY